MIDEKYAKIKIKFFFPGKRMGNSSSTQLEQTAIHLLESNFPDKKDKFNDYRVVIRSGSGQGAALRPVFPSGFAMEKYPWQSTFLLFKKLNANVDETGYLGIEGITPYFLGQIISLQNVNLTNEQLAQYINALDAFLTYLKAIREIQEENRLIIPRLSKWVLADGKDLKELPQLQSNKNVLILMYEIEGQQINTLKEVKKEEKNKPEDAYNIFLSTFIRLVATYMFHEKLQIFPHLNPDRMVWIGSANKKGVARLYCFPDLPCGPHLKQICNPPPFAVWKKELQDNALKILSEILDTDVDREDLEKMREQSSYDYLYQTGFREKNYVNPNIALLLKPLFEVNNINSMSGYFRSIIKLQDQANLIQMLEIQDNDAKGELQHKVELINQRIQNILQTEQQILRSSTYAQKINLKDATKCILAADPTLQSDELAELIPQLMSEQQKELYKESLTSASEEGMDYLSQIIGAALVEKN